jgi:tetratricopeptide (TPR) repeat protein
MTDKLHLKIKEQKGSFSTELSVLPTITTLELKILLEQHSGIPIAEMRILAGGKFLKDDSATLSQQNVRSTSKILLLRKPVNETSPPLDVESSISSTNQPGLSEKEEKKRKQILEEEEKAKRIKRIQIAAEQLARRQDGGTGSHEKHHLSLTDQNGRPITLPEQERISLLIALTLHEKGQAMMKNKEYKEALEVYTVADEEFRKLRPALLGMVDNYAYLNVDMVWCMYHISDPELLFNAKQRLSMAEDLFRKSHGPNLERLKQIRGKVAPERLLYVRLHVLQGVVAYLMDDKVTAERILKKADHERQTLIPNQDHVSSMIQMGFSEKEAKFALKATSNELDEALSYIIQKREEEGKRREREEQYKKDRREQVKIGKTSDGKSFINLEYMRQLEPMVRNDYEDVAWTRELIIEALKKTNNNVEICIRLLTMQRDTLESDAEMRVHQRRVCEKNLLELLNMGFDIDLASFSLKLLNNDLERACKALLECKIPYPKINHHFDSFMPCSSTLAESNSPTSDTTNVNTTTTMTYLSTMKDSDHNLTKSIEELDHVYKEEAKRRTEEEEIENTIDTELVDFIRRDEDELYDSDLVDEQRILNEYLIKLKSAQQQ